MLPRQARLRATFSDWYSRITPGKWHHAVWVREMALSNLRKGKPQWQVEEGRRVLSDSHFEFQGGLDAPKAIHGVERRMVRRG
jgi:hypothetical protein